MTGFDPCVNYVGIDGAAPRLWRVCVLDSTLTADCRPLWCDQFEDVGAICERLLKLHPSLLIATSSSCPPTRAHRSLPGASWVRFSPWEIALAKQQHSPTTRRFHKAYALAVTAAYRHQAPRILQQLQVQLNELQRLVLCDDLPF